jgi:hypothetical protein
VAAHRAADEMRLGLRRGPAGCQMRTLHDMREAAGGFDLVDPRRRNLKVKRGPPTVAPNAMRLALPSADHGRGSGEGMRSRRREKVLVAGLAEDEPPVSVVCRRQVQ